METAYANINWQIWLFFDAVVEWELVEDTEQQVTVRVFHHDLGQHMMMTFVYAKCSAIEGLDLWDHLYYLASDMELPWLVGGDFNVILHEDEKIGGLPVHPPEYEDFAFYVNFIVCLSKGTKEVHSHGGMGDPMLSNMLPTIEVKHLIRTGSDHAPLLMHVGCRQPILSSLSDSSTFGQSMLHLWMWETFGDIFKQLDILEDIVRVKEMLFEEEPTTENRIVLQMAQFELKKYLSIEEQYWKQKVGMTWFAEGDRNTSFFHNHVNGKRKKLQLKRIKSGSGVWIEDQEQLATTAVDFYQK
ncbi:uncharacterized protein LOC142169943 [Nicotiana tabacum]|uniref:Uncharacterized protein LOC142169943 n=1 Tax=Nicotiana tabacum TaxID=4097 RepID=A0AC58SSQ7_TOBAC